MKYWIDVASLPHVHFFRALIKRLEKSGNDVLVTSRQFGIMNDILEKNNIQYTSVGSHGGKDLESKLIHSSERIIQLTKLLSKEKPDLAISKHSIECARVSFGLGIPSVMVIDHETAAKQSRLTTPITDVIVSPKATDMNKMKKYGAKKIMEFYGVCETSHFFDFKPTRDVLDVLGIESGKVIIARTEPLLASHNFHKSALYATLEGVKKNYPDSNIVFIPRGKVDAEQFSKLDVIIPKKYIDTLSLYNFADIMIGAGSCMNREACVGGCPTISLCPDNLPGVDKLLVKEGIMNHTKDTKRAVSMAKKILDSDDSRKKNGKLVERLDDPYKAINRAIDIIMK